MSSNVLSADGSPCLYMACEANVSALTIAQCDDNNSNTFDYCDPFTGACVFVADSPNPGQCANAIDCDNGNASTADRCSASGQCANPLFADVGEPTPTFCL